MAVIKQRRAPEGESLTFPVTRPDDASRLRESLEPGLEEEVLHAIEKARQGIEVTDVVIRRSTEPEDPDWEELVFEARVEAPASDALAYWSRIDDILDSSPRLRDECGRPILVHVAWP